MRIITDLAKLPKDLAKWNKQRKFAVSVGINWTAWDVRAHLQDRMQEVFDRPNRFTIGGIRVKKATPKNFDANVHLKDFAGKGTAAGTYLQPQIEGGRRRHKRSERLLIMKGFMKSSQWLMPAKDAPLDQYGNIRGSVISKALSDIGGQLDMYQRTRQRKRKYFWRVETDTAPAGIYYRKSGREVPLMVVVSGTPGYSKRFDFYGDARTHTNKIIGKKIDRAMDRYVNR